MYSESIKLHNEHFRVNWTCTSEYIKLHNEHFRVNWTCTVSLFSYVMNTLE